MSPSSSGALSTAVPTTGSATRHDGCVRTDELRARWLTLTRHDLPARAEAERWPLRADHCFQRVVLDAVCGGRWYDHVVGRPAYLHLAPDRLEKAVSLAESLATGPDARELLERLDAQSLRWRGKPPKARPARGPAPTRGARHDPRNDSSRSTA